MMMRIQLMGLLGFGLVILVVGQESPQQEDLLDDLLDSLSSLEFEFEGDQCSQQIFNFTQECNSQNLQIGAFRTMGDDQIAACCWKPECCESFREIVQQNCLPDTCENYDMETQQLIGTYHALCAGNQRQLPSCSAQDILTIPLECQQLNTQLLEQCSYRSTPVETFIRPRDDGEASCCWPGSCCDLTTQYFQKGCNVECLASNVNESRLGDYMFGAGVANIWSQICLLPEEDRSCADTTTNQAPQRSRVPAPIDTDQVLVDFRASQEVSQDNYEVIEARSDVGQAPGQNTVCQKSVDDFVRSDFGQEGQWTTTVRIFCNFTLTELRETSQEVVQLCCDITQQMFQGACDYYSCYPTPIEFFTPKVFDILSLWQVVCSPQVENCNLDDALTISSGGSLNQLEILQQQTTIQYQDTSQTSTSNSNANTPVVPVSSVQVSTEGISIYRAIERIPMLSTFNYGLQFINLEQQLALVDSPITMFAPTNTAFSTFSRFLNISADAIINSIGGDSWQALHLVHISLQTLYPQDVQAGQRYTLYTLESGQLAVEADLEGGVSLIGCCSELNRAGVISSAVFGDGVLWVIDAMVLPAALAGQYLGNL